MCCIWTYSLWQLPILLLFDLINGLSLLALYSYSWRVSCFLLFLVSERFPCPIFHLHHNRGRRIIPFSTAHRIFTKARWLGFSANIFLTNLGSFVLINSNSHESALTCSILCRLRDILKHTLSNLFPFSQQQRFALPHFHGHCKPPFHSWPLLSTLQLVACFPTALTTACGLSEKERVRFGEEFLRGVGGWYLGHPPPSPSPRNYWQPTAQKLSVSGCCGCGQKQPCNSMTSSWDTVLNCHLNQRLRTILSCKQDTHRDQSWLLGRICRPREMQLLPLVLFWSEAVHGWELRIFIWFFSLKHETFASY